MTSRAVQAIVDTHQHLWDLDRFSLPWTKDEKSLAHSFLMADYFKATAGLNIAQTVYMEVDVEPKQQEAEARYVIELCQRDDNPMTAAVISGRPASEEFGGYVAKFKSNPQIKGVRQVLHVATTPQGYCLDSKFVRGVQLLGERGLSFDLCMRSGELLDADKLVAQCPHTRFIVDHCGNMSVQEKDNAKRKTWQLGMQHLADHDNVVCKVSGIVASAAEKWTAADLAPNIRFTLETFGPDRVMFGGDWPVCTLRATYRAWVEALQEIVNGESDTSRQKLFQDNAVKFYGLPPKGKKWSLPK
ncbi:MAG TPA: amidohydrolase family protein [Pirellulales bacterium]|jgi:predicted TIM-barrel fold metal-dependent hydrolase